MGFWSDLADRGVAQIKSEASRRIQEKGQSAHIDEQNQAGAEMADVLNRVHNATITNAEAQSEIRKISSAFIRFTQELGYARAIQGGSEIAALAGRILSDLQRDAAGGPGLPAIGGFSLENFDSKTIVLLVLLGYVVMRRR